VELCKSFLSHFIGNRTRHKSATYLLTVKQESNESLRSYIAQFNEKNLTIDGPGMRVVLLTLLGGIWPHIPFMAKVARKLPQHLDELTAKGEEFINVEEFIKAFVEQAK
jgi:hypothetical protein